MKTTRTAWGVGLALALSLCFGGCAEQAEGGTNTNWISCETTDDCPGDQACVDDRCVPIAETGGASTGGRGATADGGASGGTNPGSSGGSLARDGGGATNSPAVCDVPGDRFCIVSARPDGTLVAGDPLIFRVQSMACYASSCTNVDDVSCSAVAVQGGELSIDGALCITRITSVGGCTADCYHPTEDCRPGVTLTAGAFTAVLPGGGRLGFQVPSTLPAEGICGPL